MWEEHPSYQKKQMLIIGLFVLGCIIWCAGSAIANHDWQLLKQVLLFTGALVLALGLIFGDYVASGQDFHARSPEPSGG